MVDGWCSNQTLVASVNDRKYLILIEHHAVESCDTSRLASKATAFAMSCRSIRVYATRTSDGSALLDVTANYNLLKHAGIRTYAYAS